MQAPICFVCRTWGSGDFVQFKVVDPLEIRRNADIAKATEPFYGGPHGQYYFCYKHLRIGHRYSDLTTDEAGPLLVRAFEEEKTSRPSVLDRIRNFFGKKIG